MALTYSAPAVDLTLKIIESYGIDPDPLLRELTIDPALVEDPNARFRYTQIDDLWYRASEQVGDEAFGLRAARFWHPSHLGALGYAWLSSSSLRTALQRFARYIRILTEGAELELSETDEIFSVILNYKEISRQQATRTDSFMAMLVAMIRCNYGDEFNPLSVAFTHDPPSDSGPYYELFRCPVSFSVEKNQFDLSIQDVDKRLVGSHPRLAQLNDQVMTEYLVKLDRDNITERVKAAIIDQLPSGRLSDGVVAEALYMNVRTMQRRLQQEGTTFKTLLNEVRQDLADTYIRDSSLTLNEISFMLGFSEISSFSRAFKRWTGKAPSTYRRV